MARKKEYNKEEVLEKAMYLFWRNGYENTSTRMLEKEMGINQFSIYSSFGSKEGLFLESVKCYRNKLNVILKKLEKSTNGIKGIKEYFYDFIEFSKENNIAKGCLLVNTINELGNDSEIILKSDIQNFTGELMMLFMQKLSVKSKKDSNAIATQANYLLISLVGLSVASKVFDKRQLKSYIETTFRKL